MFIRTAIIASAAFALLASVTEAHSWADCVDWRFNNPKKPGFGASSGKCHAWARKYPVNNGMAFGTLDSDYPNRHYQQDPSDFTPCSDRVHGREPGADETRQSPISKSYGGDYGSMASTTAGSEMCIRWPAKNHAIKNEPSNPVYINMPQTILSKDPSQSVFTKANIETLDYKNCSATSSTDFTPCGGCFTIPKTLKTGTYVVQWRWMLNTNEWYTSCWDVAVTGKSSSKTTTTTKAKTTTTKAKATATTKAKTTTTTKAKTTTTAKAKTTTTTKAKTTTTAKAKTTTTAKAKTTTTTKAKTTTTTAAKATGTGTAGSLGSLTSVFAALAQD